MTADTGLLMARLFLCPWSRWEAKKLSQGSFSDTLIGLEALKEYLYFVQKNRLFSKG